MCYFPRKHHNGDGSTVAGGFRWTLAIQNEQEVFTAMMALKSGEGSFADALVGALGRWAGCGGTLTFDKKAGRLDGFVTV